MKFLGNVCRHLLLPISMAGAFLPGVSDAQTTSTPLTQEYFVQQTANEDLLIKINSFEAEFESRLTAQNGEVLLVSGVPGNRIAPIFQYVSASTNSRQLEIQVSSSLHTKRSQFGIELVRMSAWDERSRSVSRAYQLLSFGMQVNKGVSRADWTVKIDSLVNAGRLFQRFGMQEMRLWSNYLAAYLVQTQLHDFSIVYSMTHEILANLKGSRLRKIEMAALQLQAAALIGLKRSGALDIQVSSADPVQAILSQVVEFAESIGFDYEMANALNLSGEAYLGESSYASALERFQNAKQIADRIGAEELAREVRERIVEIHAIQGNVPASGEVLREIETQLLEGGGGDELALNLLAQGRLLARTYHYREAVDILNQSLSHENNSAIRKQINFELAKVFYESGRLDESMNYLKMAEVEPDVSRPQRANSVLDIGPGLRIMANIHRSRGEFDKMRMARTAQGRHNPVAAGYLYDQGLDELAIPVKNPRRAQSLFGQSHQAAVKSGHVDLQHLSRLQFCALGSMQGSTQSLCSNSAVNASYEWLINGGIPRFAAEAMRLQAQILASTGRKSEAIATMDRLLDEIHLFRHSLPGVLGAWYRERHQGLFDNYLDQLISSASRRGRVDGSPSLLALSKIRRIENYTGSRPVLGADFPETKRLRMQLAQRANARPGQDLVELNAEIARELAAQRLPFQKKFAYLSSAGLSKYLKSLSRNERVLTYHISPTSTRVWVGENGKVQTQDIPNTAYIYSALQEARQGLADIGKSAFNSKMDALGERLIGPVKDLLADRVYWISAGSLQGFPLDALRLEGRYLFERHRFVGLLSFPANVNPSASLRAGSLGKVFLAGLPQDYSSDYASRLETSAEISAIADIFVGPGLRIIQGVALLPDEFEDEQFRNANILHLSMPGIIDLGSPDESSLELSAGEYDPERVAYKPEDIRSQQLAADLVFLSSTELRNEPLSAYNIQTGLVSDFIDAGVQSVIASLWSLDGPASEDLMTNFYLELKASGNIINALNKARGQYLDNNSDNGLYDWVSFQLFVE